MLAGALKEIHPQNRPLALKYQSKYTHILKENKREDLLCRNQQNQVQRLGILRY